MSATIPNVEEIGNWLRAKCFCSDFRPVPLVEMYKLEDTIYSSDVIN